MVTRNLPIGWMSPYVLLIGSLAMVLGCSANFQHNVINEHTPSHGVNNSSLQETYGTLVHQGQFTKAMILNSLHESASFNMRGSAPEMLIRQENESTLNKKRQTLAIVPSQNHQAFHSPTREELLPSERHQATGLDGKRQTELGWSLLIVGNYEGAVAAYREALRQNQSLAEAYLGLGMSLKMQNQVSAAIDAYQQALHLQPNYAAALVHLGYVYADGGTEHRDVQKAQQLFHLASRQGDPFATIALRELNARP